MRDYSKIIYGLIIVAVVVQIGVMFSNNQYVSRKLGGSTTEQLPKNVKLVNITWKENNLWILTRPMKDGEQPETYTFKESSLFGALEGTVIIKESK